MTKFICWFLGIVFVLYLVDVFFGHPGDEFDEWFDNDFWLEEDPDEDDKDLVCLRASYK